MQRLDQEGDGILLIYDNAIDADALGPHLPRDGAARVLITSNADAGRGVATPVEIQVWPKETGADFLIDTRRAAEALRLAQIALATHEATSGPNHPWTKDSARIVADALGALDRGDEAAALRAR
jgi:hypothetical protein